MATSYWKDVQAYLHDFDATGRTNEATLDVQVQQNDVTTFGSDGWHELIAGRKSYAWQVAGFQDFASGSVDANLGVDTTFTMTAGSTFTIAAASAVGSPAYFGTVEQGAYTPIAGSVGDAARFNAAGWGRSTLYRGYLGMKAALVSATGEVAATEWQAGSQENKTPYLALHVIAFDATAATIQVRSAATAGGGSGTSRVSVDVTGTGSSITAGSVLTAITHPYWKIRLNALTGTSVTFAASYGFV